LFEQKATLAAAAKAKLADELLVARATASGPLHAANQVTVGLRVRPLLCHKNIAAGVVGASAAADFRLHDAARSCANEV
jgi:hypothetical protein